ncbi:uncharacterized protein PHACADRAFT_258927 [Phanerochaete carnosa HHB-10118-sp]|uniref:non-specific serine/threonine protein kinase n=1 Tax=Phanerochaete carnosa (strain HHB-10118-sp) TaxID=650164 RepID=K5W6R2_PHACS|nr:uncharacterized protein PHACADRAFT_258927 [Phanerochaete carnosa HHB-10118-sp]EKM54810.1 hypothetical protein PHACADRAFT_258927 [Phanerochaete carnosa HHB-10118-sp]
MIVFIKSLANVFTNLFYGAPAVPDPEDLRATPVRERELADFYEGVPGEVLHGYKLQVKLGGGAHSTTWLTSSTNRRGSTQYRAAKLLSRDATQEVHRGIMLEVEAMKKLREHGDFPGLPMLHDDFEFLGGAHICLVMNVLGSDIGSFRRSADNKALPLNVVRTIMRQVTAATAYLHKCGIVHTDIKPDNILFHTSMGAQEIDSWLSNVGDETEVHPLPNNWATDCGPEEAEKIKVSLVDLGQCQWVGQTPTVQQFSAYSLRAPEVILQCDIGPGIDIWAIGCVVFEMLVGRWLFHPIAGDEDWTLEDDHLAKMMELTGEQFSARMLARSRLREQYFDDQGNLLRVEELYPVAIEDAMANYKILPQEEVGPAANFVRHCCRLDPEDRPTAETLVNHPWFSTGPP